MTWNEYNILVHAPGFWNSTNTEALEYGRAFDAVLTYHPAMRTFLQTDTITERSASPCAAFRILVLPTCVTDLMIYVIWHRRLACRMKIEARLHLLRICYASTHLVSRRRVGSRQRPVSATTINPGL